MVDTVITVKLQRGEGTSWGFRLAGGKDFGYPLSVQREGHPRTADKEAKLHVGEVWMEVEVLVEGCSLRQQVASSIMSNSPGVHICRLRETAKAIHCQRRAASRDENPWNTTSAHRRSRRTVRTSRSCFCRSCGNAKGHVAEAPGGRSALACLFSGGPPATGAGPFDARFSSVCRRTRGPSRLPLLSARIPLVSPCRMSLRRSECATGRQNAVYQCGLSRPDRMTAGGCQRVSIAEDIVSELRKGKQGENEENRRGEANADDALKQR
ncbi:hypothetical protein HPB51_013888 [Rhipicephalus microplus]|uniref:PDZ domain-containing protein n=1 Tax=Rhipicephalus microplus TaxID=6941 RepID=A0A9J6EGP5_RHIMP|nr:hypothetical protein HPB51_013888 [Rhipicephalus microplus]